jgi:YVTN family beta-propeller protein
VLLAAIGPSIDADEPDAGPSPIPSTSTSTPTTRVPIASPSRSIAPPSRSNTNVWAAISSKHLSPVVRGDRAYVYVPNGRPGTLEVIDPRTLRIVRRVSLGAGSYPEHVTPSWDLRRLYVDVDGASELAVIDPKTGRLIHIVHGIDHPYNLYFTPDGSTAIDVVEYHDRLDFMNPHTWKPIRSLQLPCNGPDHLDFGPPGTHYFVIGCEFDGRVIKVDWRRRRVVDQASVGGLPVDVKLSPDGRVFYVANQGLGGVSIVDASNLRSQAFIPTGRGAHGLAISRDTHSLYVSNRLAGTISVIRFSTRKVTHTWAVGGSPDMLQVSPDGAQLWTSNRYGTTITVINTTNGRIIHQIEVGPDPHGLCYFPQPGTYSLGHNGVFR